MLNQISIRWNFKQIDNQNEQSRIIVSAFPRFKVRISKFRSHSRISCFLQAVLLISLSTSHGIPRHPDNTFDMEFIGGLFDDVPMRFIHTEENCDREGAQSCDPEKYWLNIEASSRANTFQNLTILKASSSQIPKYLFSVFPQLVNFDMSHQNVARIVPADFENATDLENLDMSYNIIEQLDLEVFTNAPNLTKIDFSHNLISVINFPADLKDTNKFKEIDLHNNRLVSFSTPTGSFSKLLRLTLTDNLLEEVSPTFPYTKKGAIKRLQSVELSDNPTLRAMGPIRIDSNSVHISNSSVRTLFIFPKILRLNASNNNIFEIIMEDDADYAIRELSLPFNSLTSVANFSNHNFNNLTSLDLSHNLLEKIDLTAFANMNSLVELDLSFNKLFKIDFRIIPESLLFLNASYNRLKRLQMNETTHSNLRRVDLERNQLTELEVDRIKQMAPNLSSIDLNENSWNCTNLNEIVLELNVNNIEPVLKGNWKEIAVKHGGNVNGIACINTVQISLLEGYNILDITRYFNKKILSLKHFIEEKFDDLDEKLRRLNY